MSRKAARSSSARNRATPRSPADSRRAPRRSVSGIDQVEPVRLVDRPLQSAGRSSSPRQVDQRPDRRRSPGSRPATVSPSAAGRGGDGHAHSRAVAGDDMCALIPRSAVSQSPPDPPERRRAAMAQHRASARRRAPPPSIAPAGRALVAPRRRRPRVDAMQATPRQPDVESPRRSKPKLDELPSRNHPMLPQRQTPRPHLRSSGDFRGHSRGKSPLDQVRPPVGWRRSAVAPSWSVADHAALVGADADRALAFGHLDVEAELAAFDDLAQGGAHACRCALERRRDVLDADLEADRRLALGQAARRRGSRSSPPSSRSSPGSRGRELPIVPPTSVSRSPATTNSSLRSCPGSGAIRPCPGRR